VRGKPRAAQNARRHGLASLGGEMMSPANELLARALAGTSPSRLVHARAIAAMQVMLERISQARIAIIDRALRSNRPAAEPEQLVAAEIEAAAVLETIDELLSLERYEVRALSRRGRAVRCING
jgi:hypothetical protein